jgi:hypothetical protein
MNTVGTFRALIIVSGIATLAAANEWRQGQRATHPPPALSPSIPPSQPVWVGIVDTATLDSLTTAISDHDPFRLTREPSTVAYTTEPDGAPPPSAAARPPISLSGVIGPPWTALLEGTPGHEGTLLARVGDTVARAPSPVLIVRRITHDTVVVQGADTAWRLTVRRLWR